MTTTILELITEQYHSLTRFNRKLADYILANIHDSQYMSISSLAEKDVILFFSYSGSTKNMKDIIRIAKERHVSIILVTHFPNSRATEYAGMPVLRFLQTQPGNLFPGAFRYR